MKIHTTKVAGTQAMHGWRGYKVQLNINRAALEVTDTVQGAVAKDRGMLIIDVHRQFDALMFYSSKASVIN